MIAADSSATFGASVRTIEVETAKKIEIVGSPNGLIIAGTGYVGHHQRYVEAVGIAHSARQFVGKSEIEIAKHLAAVGVNDFGTTTPASNMQRIPYSALVAYQARGQPCLCELEGQAGFQPEVKRLDDFWFASTGSGQSITDPFLALFRQIFWKDAAPDIKGGIFTAYWALKSACDFNPGGINYPIRVAVLGTRGGKIDAWMLDDDALAEHHDAVEAASEYFGAFKEKILASAVSSPPKA